MRCFVLVPILLAACARPASSQETALATERTASGWLAVQAAVLMSGERGYGLLPQPAFSSAAGLRFGGRFGAIAETRGLFVLPSAYSDIGYRYRGFEGGALLAGAYRETGSLTAAILAGAGLARYSLSDSYFFFPVLEARLEWLLPLPKAAGTWRAVLSVPCFMRADAASAGMALGASWSRPAASITEGYDP